MVASIAYHKGIEYIAWLGTPMPTMNKSNSRESSLTKMFQWRH